MPSAIRFAFEAFRRAFADPEFLRTFGESVINAVAAIVVSLLVIVPTAYWVTLKVPRLRPVIEFITLLPFVIPAVVLVFGLIRMYSPSAPCDSRVVTARHGSS